MKSNFSNFSNFVNKSIISDDIELVKKKMSYNDGAFNVATKTDCNATRVMLSFLICSLIYDYISDLYEFEGDYGDSRIRKMNSDLCINRRTRETTKLIFMNERSEKYDTFVNYNFSKENINIGVIFNRDDNIYADIIIFNLEELNGNKSFGIENPVLYTLDTWKIIDMIDKPDEAELPESLKDFVIEQIENLDEKPKRRMNTTDK